MYVLLSKSYAWRHLSNNLKTIKHEKNWEIINIVNNPIEQADKLELFLLLCMSILSTKALGKLINNYQIIEIPQINNYLLVCRNKMYKYKLL